MFTCVTYFVILVQVSSIKSMCNMIWMWMQLSPTTTWDWHSKLSRCPTSSCLTDRESKSKCVVLYPLVFLFFVPCMSYIKHFELSCCWKVQYKKTCLEYELKLPSQIMDIFLKSTDKTSKVILCVCVFSNLNYVQADRGVQ